MGYLSSLTPEEVQAIADVLPAAPVVDPPAAVDGAALYGSSCAGCHHPLDTTSKPGRSAAQIQAAIDGNIGSMGSSQFPDSGRGAGHCRCTASLPWC